MSAKTIKQSELHELLITRTFDAPQWLVWQRMDGTGTPDAMVLPRRVHVVVLRR